MDKLERLLNLTMTLLQTPRPLTAAEIRERIAGYPDSDLAFRRAFERDKESLRDMGVPISVEPITHTDPPADGYRIHEADYYLRDPGFEPDELAALHLAASAVRLDSAHGVEGLWKLGGAGDAVAPGGDGSFGEPVAALPGDPNLGPLFTAVAERRSAAFRYNDRDRTVDPYRLDFQRGRWYLTGFDQEKEEERNFRVDRIDGEVTLGEPRSFDRPETGVRGGPAQPWQFGEGDPITAELLVDRDQAGWVRGHLGEDAVAEERPDGSIVFQVGVNNWPAFRSFVLTFLEHAEILAPAELRTQLVDFLEAQA